MRALALEHSRKAAILVQSADLLENGYKSDQVLIANEIRRDIDARATLLAEKDARIAELEAELAEQ